MKYRVFFSPEAKVDIEELYDYIAGRSGEDRALGYIERIEEREWEQRQGQQIGCGLVGRSAS